MPTELPIRPDWAHLLGPVEDARVAQARQISSAMAAVVVRASWQPGVRLRK
jgi:hypothetical protein